MSISYIVSLGCSCMPAIQLNRKGLKEWAYPFDWAKTTWEALLFVLQNGLKESYIDIPLEEWKNKPSIRFIHHDIRIPERQEFLRRCDTRLKDVLAGNHNQRVLFIRFDDNPTNFEKSHELLECLSKTCSPTLDFILVHIRWHGISSKPECKQIDSHHDRLKIYDIWSRHYSHRQYMLEWLEDIDETTIWDTILDQFTFDLVKNNKVKIDRKSDHYDLSEGLMDALYDSLYEKRESVLDAPELA